MTILSPEVPDDDLPNQIDTISGYVATAGGEVSEVLRESPWGRRRLAYPIRHEGRDLRDGFYTVFHFSIAPGQVAEIERELKLNSQLMRFLITLYEPVVSPHQPQLGADQQAAPQSVAEVASAPAAAAEPASVEAVDVPSEASAAVATATETETPAESSAVAESPEPVEAIEAAETPESVETEEASQELIDAVAEADEAEAPIAEAPTAEAATNEDARAEDATVADAEPAAGDDDDEAETEAAAPKGETEEA